LADLQRTVFPHVVTRQLQVERRTGKVRRSKTNVLPTVPRNQPVIACEVLILIAGVRKLVCLYKIVRETVIAIVMIVTTAAVILYIMSQIGPHYWAKM